MRALIFISLLVLLSLAVNCGGGSGAAEFQLRFINASPDAPALDLMSEERIVLAANTYLSVANTSQFAASSGPISVRGVASSNTLAELMVDLSATSNYLLAAIDYVGSLRLVLFEYPFTAVPPDQFSWVRVVHAAPAGPALDLYVASPGLSIRELEPVASNISFGNNSEFVQVASGKYQIRFAQTGSKEQELDAGTVTLSSQSVSTVFIAESKAGSSAYASIVLNDKDI